MARAERRDATLSVIMLDVDNLKHITDEYGHKSGDKVMSELATALLAHTRISDSACHYGGGEFVLLLPDTATGPATMRAEHLRVAITALAIKLEDGPVCRVHVSLGIANYPNDGRQPDALIKAADRALYLAKHSRTHPESLADNTTE
jgi:diguanylate cyclase (GGDEF)-like protein